MKTINWARILIRAHEVALFEGTSRYACLECWIAARINRQIAREQSMTAIAREMVIPGQYDYSDESAARFILSAAEDATRE
jgi:hypothetical protein